MTDGIQLSPIYKSNRGINGNELCPNNITNDRWYSTKPYLHKYIAE